MPAANEDFTKRPDVDAATAFLFILKHPDLEGMSQARMLALIAGWDADRAERALTESQDMGFAERNS